MSNREQPLTVEVNDGRLVISIGVDVLAFAVTYCSRFYDGLGDQYKARIIDNDQWAQDVARELTREQEDGTNPLHILLDNAFEKAAEDGSAAIEIGDI